MELVFFRMRNLRLSFPAFLPYGLMAITLLVLTWQLDRVAALSLLPYVADLG